MFHDAYHTRRQKALKASNANACAPCLTEPPMYLGLTSWLVVWQVPSLVARVP